VRFDLKNYISACRSAVSLLL